MGVINNRMGWLAATHNLLVVSCTYPPMEVVADVEVDTTTIMITVFPKSFRPPSLHLWSWYANVQIRWHWLN